MTSPTLDRLEKLAAEATPAPWEADHAVYPYEDEHQGKTSRAIYHNPKPHHTVEVVESPDELHGECIHNEADWHLICELRNNAQAMLEALRAGEFWLRAEDDANNRDNYPLSGIDYPVVAKNARERFRASMEKLK